MVACSRLLTITAPCYAALSSTLALQLKMLSTSAIQRLLVLTCTKPTALPGASRSPKARCISKMPCTAAGWQKQICSVTSVQSSRLTGLIKETHIRVGFFFYFLCYDNSFTIGELLCK